MEKTKFECELNSLVKLGVPEEMAYLIACNKFKKNMDEVEERLNQVKESQYELMEALKEFIPFHENLKIQENNNISNNNDKNEDSPV
jgi:hypothetical protein